MTLSDRAKQIGSDKTSRVLGRLAVKAEAGAVLDLLCTGQAQIPLSEKVCSSEHRADYCKETERWCRERCVRVVERDGVLAAMLVLFGEEIRYLVVRPTFQRQGLAQGLLAHAARRMRSLRAKVRPENVRIIALLTRAGFRRDHVYDDPPWIGFSWSRQRPSSE